MVYGFGHGDWICAGRLSMLLIWLIPNCSAPGSCQISGKRIQNVTRDLMIRDRLPV